MSVRNISFNFVGNLAPLGGTSIYSETIFSCYYAYHQNNGAMKKNLTDFFGLIGDFHFDNTIMPLATAARNVTVLFSNATSPLMTLPGKLLHLPLAMIQYCCTF